MSLFELPFGKALYLHVRRVLSRLKVCQRHGLTRFGYNALERTILSKISCNGKETLENYAVRIAIGLEPFTSPYNPLRIPPL